MAALGGFALFAAFPPLSWWPSALVGVALFSAAAARAASVHFSALVGFVTGLAFFVPLLSWADVVGVLPWLLLGVSQAAFFAPLGVVFSWAARRPLLWRLVASGGAWVAVEALRSRVPFGGFPWGRLGVSQAPSPLLDLAAWGGVPLVSFVVVFSGVAFAALFSLRSYWLVVPLALPFVFALLVPPPALSSRVVEVALVQGGVPEFGLPEDVRRREVLSRHVAATEALADRVSAGEVPRPAVVLWPENASDADPFVDPEAAALIGRAQSALDVPLLVGAVVASPSGDTIRNLVVHWDASGPVSSYQKQHPVPFGEYIPYRSLVGGLFGSAQLVPRDFVPGSGPGFFRLSDGAGSFTVGPLICFEVAYDPLVRTAARGSDFLVVATNNASFGMSAESPQQLDFSRLRAVESGRAVVVVSTSGISAVVFPDGSVSDSLGIGEVGSISAALPVPASDPVALRLGAFVELVLALLALAAFPFSRAGTTRPLSRLRVRRSLGPSRLHLSGDVGSTSAGG